MDIELEKLNKLEHALCDAIDILRDWQVEEVKPEEEKWIAYLARSKNSDYLTAGRADRWESIQKDYGAKTKLFIGAYDEAVRWYDARQKFAETVKAWEDGKRIQVTPKGTDKWLDLHCKPTWDVNLEYRVKPKEKKYRPYINSDEMIMDFINRFNVKCPSYCEPLIWVKDKDVDRRTLVSAFREDSVSIDFNPFIIGFEQLLNDYTYLDGSPCGMEEKE